MITIGNFNEEEVLTANRREAIYFDFEEDFVEENIRCIPMCVRFKLDACGIKLQLREWSKMSVGERNSLAEMSCLTDMDIRKYRSYLQQIIFNRTGNNATELMIDKNPAWCSQYAVPPMVKERLNEFGWAISLRQWAGLTNLQRFALMKLSKPGHEQRNFPLAVKEFSLA